MTHPLESRGWSHLGSSGRIAYVNGRFVAHPLASVHIEDRGLQFSDAVYEVFGVARHRILDEDEHLDRLERSLRELEMAMPMSRAPLKLLLRETARRNRVANGLIYLQVTRGTFRRDHPIPAGGSRPTLILTARNVDTESLAVRQRDGVKVMSRPDERWGRCDIKSTSLLANVLAKTVARRGGAFEAWLVDAEGFVTEGSSTTAWIVDSKRRLITRPLSEAILPGVTRRVILDVAAQAQIPVLERRFSKEDVGKASEAFISAATIGAIPVVMIDGKPVGSGVPGPITRRIQELYLNTALSRATNDR